MTNIRTSATQTDTRIFVHSMTNKEHRIALKLNPYALVHIGLWDEQLAPYLETLKNAACVMSTAALHQASGAGIRLRERPLDERQPFNGKLQVIHQRPIS